jgi:predicted DNA-binding protein YlxM (UPF0122 family)
LALTLPIEKAKSMARLLLKLGATSSQADLHGCTVFHRYVSKAELGMIDALWELDKTGVKAALNHLLIGSQYWNPSAISPLHTAIGRGDTALVLRLLEAGSNPQIDFESWLKAAKFQKRLESRLSSYEENLKMYKRSAEQPLMIALKSSPDPEVAYRLLQKGADPNSMTPISYQLLHDEWARRYNKGETGLDLVRKQLTELRKYTGEKFHGTEPELPEGIDEFLEKFKEGTWQHWLTSEDIKKKREAHEKALKDYETRKQKFEEIKGATEKKEAIEEAIAKMEKVEKLMLENGGKTFQELHPEIEAANTSQNNAAASTDKADIKKDVYEFKFTFRETTDVTEVRHAAYLEL